MSQAVTIMKQYLWMSNELELKIIATRQMTRAVRTEEREGIF
jgi:hypothetical protein